MDEKTKTETRINYDRYTVVDGKFVHLTPEYYNPHFDGARDENGNIRNRKKPRKPKTDSTM